MKSVFVLTVATILSSCSMLEVDAHNNMLRDLALKKANEYCKNHGGVYMLNQRINDLVMFTVLLDRQQNSFHVQCQGSFAGNFEVEL